ncbi:MAG: oligoendopeptidase F [Clostridiales bacterium]|nr:oligoendopeptidase F [Clostridiales bacterium]
MAQDSKRLKKREEIDNKYKWNLQDMYPDDEVWEKDFASVREKAKELEGYSGRLGENSEVLFEALDKKDQLSRMLGNIYVYARMKKDEDNNITKYQAMSEKAQALSVEIGTQLAFFTPEIIDIPEERLLSFIDENEKLKVYEFLLKDLMRQKQHVLSKQEEYIIAQFGELVSAPESIFRMINNADIKFGYIKDDEGDDIEVTHGRFISFLESPNRRIREDAFNALYAAYEKQKNTIASTYNYSTKGDVVLAKLRKYNSSLEEALDGDNIPIKVYDNLIQTVHENIDLLHRYINVRKKMLNLDDLHIYDLYTPIVKEVDRKIPYEEGLRIIEKALQPMGEEYVTIMKEGFHGGWIDVYENEGKTSGAYSFGTYDSFPYILLNYSDTIKDVFTIAHEMGHSMHSYYSRRNQPYVYGGHSIFTAEVASTVNEALLMDYMIQQSKDKTEKMYLLNYFMEQFRGTLFRQTMFAEFEKMTHEAVEAGEVLTKDWLCNTYYDLNKFYYGNELIHDKAIQMEWARIPHFYSAFYVYKYATGYSAAIELSRKILDEGKIARNRYIDFLKSGNSNYPIELLKIAGVDMASPKPIRNAMKTFKELVEQFEMFV